MIETTDPFFLHPRQVLTAGKVGIYDAINLVIYGRLPLSSAKSGIELVAGFQCDGAQQALTKAQADQLIDKFRTEAASLRYPVGPTQYEPILERLLEAGEDVLPFFYHEHHLLVDRRQRIADCTSVIHTLQEEVKKGEVILQLSESERTQYMASGAWMTNKTLTAFLDRQGVTPWWECEANLVSHARLERVMTTDSPSLLSPKMMASYGLLDRDIMSDTPASPSLDTRERYDTQQLPSFVFAEMLLRRSRRPRGYAKPARLTSDTILVEPVVEQREDSRSQNDSTNLNTVNPNAAPYTDGLHANAVGIFASSMQSSKHPRPLSQRAESSSADTEARPERRGNDAPISPESLPASELTPTSDDVMLSKTEVAALLNVHVNTVDNYRKLPDFPKPVKYSPTTLRWKRSDIVRWRDSQKKQSR